MKKNKIFKMISLGALVLSSVASVVAVVVLPIGCFGQTKGQGVQKFENDNKDDKVISKLVPYLKEDNNGFSDNKLSFSDFEIIDNAIDAYEISKPENTLNKDFINFKNYLEMFESNFKMSIAGIVLLPIGIIALGASSFFFIKFNKKDKREKIDNN